MQIRTDDQSCDITRPGLKVDQYRQLGRWCGFDSKLLSWGVFPETQTQLIKEIEEEALNELIEEANANVEDEEGNIPDTESSLEADDTELVVAPSECDDGQPDIQINDEAVQDDTTIRETLPESQDELCDGGGEEIHFVKVNWV